MLFFNIQDSLKFSSYRTTQETSKKQCVYLQRYDALSSLRLVEQRNKSPTLQIKVAVPEVKVEQFDVI